VTGFLLALSLFQANAWFSADTLYAKLKHRIDAATSSIDICFYNVDSTYIYSALIAAHNERGVRVRIITDDSRLDANWVWRVRAAGIPVWTDSIGPGRANLMHNKFAVFDYRDGNPANDWVWTGSVNIDVGSFNADNALEIQDSGLAHAYTIEFEQMWGGPDSLPDPAQAEFHSGKTDRLPRHRFPVGPDTFLLYFSPQNHPVDTITRFAGQAQQEIGFCIYSYTWRNLALTMLDRAQHAVWVGGVFDRGESTAAYSYFDSLRLWGMPVYIDKFGNNSNLLHEKIMVIDSRMVATGSVNWSNAGNSSNDENSLIAFSPAIAARYRNEISTRFNEAGGAYAQTDAAVSAILAPRGPVDTSATVTPRARVRNSGPCNANFKAFMSVRDSTGLAYSDSTYVLNLPSQGEREVSFRTWPGQHALGEYQVRCSTWSWGDTDPGNDVRQDSGEVVVLWSECADLPYGPRHKPVKAGGALAFAGDTDSNWVFALKGNRTNELYRYDYRADQWAEKESLPSVGRSGKTKRVGRGGAMTGWGTRLFALKGNNSSEFWGYDPNRASYAWGQLPDVPERRVRNGAALAAMATNDTVCIYLLKGSATREFYRFSVLSTKWETLADAPAGASGRSYRAGSGIAADGSGIVYALKGGTNEFFAYDVASRTWTTRATLPLTGRSGFVRKAGAGAGLAYANGKVYCLKGGNSTEFWEYDCSADTWVQELDFRSGGIPWLRVGGALAYAPTVNALFALKGGGRRVFRCYPLPPSERTPAGGREREAQNHSALHIPQSAILVAPNPFSGTTRISYYLPVAGYFSLKLHDVTGKLASTLATGYCASGDYSLLSTPHSLARGIYLLRLEAASGSTTQKLIIE
jgi:hypothetical protein